MTSSLPDHTVSDICFRSAPVDDFMKNIELKRIAAPGCRLTIAGDKGKVEELMPFLQSLGPQLQVAFVTNPGRETIDLNKGLFVVVFTMFNLR